METRSGAFAGLSLPVLSRSRAAEGRTVALGSHPQLNGASYS
jgi:hypothetical protein